MKKSLVLAVCGVLLVASFTALAEEFVASLKHPAPGWTTYGDIRLRQTYGWKITDLSNSHHNFGRYRARIGQKIELDDDVTFDARLIWAFRAYDDGADNHVDFGYAMFDRFNIKFENMFDMPLTGTFGRQDIMLNQWLIFDGAPLMGSTAIFFDAARLTFDFEDSQRTLDLIYIDNTTDPKDRLNVIGNRDFAVMEQNENAAIIYLTDKSIDKSKLEAYFIYKNDRAVDRIVPPTWSRKGEIFTLGGAFSQDIDENWQYRVEAAIQAGEREQPGTNNMRDLQAWGTNNKLVYNFNDKNKNSLALEYEYLSGDDGSNGTDNGFDPLWGQWPRFSELYIYTYTREAAIAEITNLHRLGLTHSFKPTKKMGLTNSYQALWADEARGAVAGIRGGDSLFRGHLLTSCLRYQFTKDLSGRLNAEYFIPGSYYDSGNQRNATFLRAEVVYSF